MCCFSPLTSWDRFLWKHSNITEKNNSNSKRDELTHWLTFSHWFPTYCSAQRCPYCLYSCFYMPKSTIWLCLRVCKSREVVVGHRCCHVKNAHFRKNKVQTGVSAPKRNSRKAEKNTLRVQRTRKQEARAHSPLLLPGNKQTTLLRLPLNFPRIRVYHHKQSRNIKFLHQSHSLLDSILNSDRELIFVDGRLI